MLVRYQLLITFILLLLLVNAMFPSELNQYLVNLASKRTLSGGYKIQSKFKDNFNHVELHAKHNKSYRQNNSSPAYIKHCAEISFEALALFTLM